MFYNLHLFLQITCKLNFSRVPPHLLKTRSIRLTLLMLLLLIVAVVSSSLIGHQVAGGYHLC
jgi:hypothetical protein